MAESATPAPKAISESLLAESTTPALNTIAGALLELERLNQAPASREHPTPIGAGGAESATPAAKAISDTLSVPEWLNLPLHLPKPIADTPIELEWLNQPLQFQSNQGHCRNLSGRISHSSSLTLWRTPLWSWSCCQLPELYQEPSWSGRA